MSDRLKQRRTDRSLKVAQANLQETVDPAMDVGINTAGARAVKVVTIRNGQPGFSDIMLND